MPKFSYDGKNDIQIISFPLGTTLNLLTYWPTWLKARTFTRRLNVTVLLHLTTLYRLWHTLSVLLRYCNCYSDRCYSDIQFLVCLLIHNNVYKWFNSFYLYYTAFSLCFISFHCLLTPWSRCLLWYCLKYAVFHYFRCPFTVILRYSPPWSSSSTTVYSIIHTPRTWKYFMSSFPFAASKEYCK